MIKAIVVITRPINVLISMLSVYLGGVISFDMYYSNDLLLACLSAGLIAGYGNICNDIYDIETDRKSKPFRPLVLGQITIKQAAFLTFILAMIGILLALTVNKTCLLIASIVSIALLVYTPIFKGRGYWGNLLISAVSAFAFFYGAAAVGNLFGGIIPAVFAFLFHFIREIVKDMEDYEADKACNVQTGAVKYGFAVSTKLAIVMILLLIFATLIPGLFRIYGPIYLIIVLAGTDIFLLYFIIRLLRAPDKAAYRFIAGSMKAVMPMGIIAVFIGSRGW